ncbi:NAD(P)/FAD-dependent oxidoreductase [Halostagnicola bangensis]
MSSSFDLEVAIVGAGPAGIGTAVVLEKLGIDYAILERDCIGASFRNWPVEMRLLTPSFPANAFGARDLNAITVDTSPALALDCEHPTGEQYAEYLEAVAEFHELTIETSVDVESVAAREHKAGFTLETDGEPVRARYVIWAAGQYDYPADGSIPGSSHAVHVASIGSWERYANRFRSRASPETDRTGAPDREVQRAAADGSGTTTAPRTGHGPATDRSRPSGGDRVETQPTAVADTVVIGGAESGIDAAIGLSSAGLSTAVLDDEGTWQFRSPDPSEVLSPRTNERLEAALADEQPIDLVADARVERIERVESSSGDGDASGEAVTGERGTEERYDVPTDDECYDVITTDSERFRSRTPPVLATGFEGSLTLVEDLFDFDGEHPDLTGDDESTKTPGLFLVGPQVAHDGQSFCFIYKFRQRFAVVAQALAERLDVETESLEEYREKRMFLEDVSCCEPDYCDC